MGCKLVEEFFERIGDIKDNTENDREDTIKIIKENYNRDKEIQENQFKANLDNKANLMQMAAIFVSIMIVLCNEKISVCAGIALFSTILISGIAIDRIVKAKKENFSFTKQYGYYLVSNTWDVYMDVNNILISGNDTNIKSEYILEIDHKYIIKIDKKQYKTLKSFYKDEIMIIDMLNTVVNKLD